MRKFLVTVNGGSYEVTVEEIGGVAPLAAPAPAPQPAAAPAPAPAPKPAAAPAPAAAAPVAGGEKISAPMPGTILSVSVQQGQQVKAGDVLLVLEAMKMENEIVAPSNGTVAQVAVTKGASVNSGDVLVVLA